MADYIAKYATKGAETATGALDWPLKFLAEPALLDVSEPARRLITAAWTLGARKDLQHLRLRAWAHMLGFRGHFSTKARRYSTTLGTLRDARAQWRHQQAGQHGPEETTLIVAHWAYAGTGLSPAEQCSPPPSPQRPAPKENLPVPGELLTVPDVMERLKLSRSAVYNLIRSRHLPSLTIGRTRRIPARSLNDYIRRHLEEAA